MFGECAHCDTVMSSHRSLDDPFRLRSWAHLQVEGRGEARYGVGLKENLIHKISKKVLLF